MGEACWRVFRAALESWWGADFSEETLRNVRRLTSWTSDQADKAARKAAYARTAALKRRLAATFRGSAGLLHRLSKWRPAWQPAIGSISKASLDEDPQKAAESELASWKQVWPECQVRL